MTLGCGMCGLRVFAVERELTAGGHAPRSQNGREDFGLKFRMATDSTETSQTSRRLRRPESSNDALS